MVLDQIEFGVVERQPEARHPLDDIEIGNVFAMVVVPHCGWRLGHVGLAIVAHGHGVGVVIIPIHAGIDHVGRVTIHMGWIVPAVQVDGFALHHTRRHAGVKGKVIPVTHNHRRPHAGLEGGAGHGAVVAENLREVGLIGAINDHLGPGPLPLGIPGGELPGGVVGDCGSSDSLVVELWRDTAVAGLGGVNVGVEGRETTGGWLGSELGPPDIRLHPDIIGPLEGRHRHRRCPLADREGGITGLVHLRGNVERHGRVPDRQRGWIADGRAARLVRKELDLDQLISLGLVIVGKDVGDTGLACLDQHLAAEGAHTEIGRVHPGTGELVIENGAVGDVGGGHRGDDRLTFGH